MHKAEGKAIAKAKDPKTSRRLGTQKSPLIWLDVLLISLVSTHAKAAAVRATKKRFVAHI